MFTEIDSNQNYHMSFRIKRRETARNAKQANYHI